jgi:GNAT superfamily N-acetyltransferase
MKFSEPNPEHKDKQPVSETLTRESLKEIIYQGERFPQDDRFQDTKDGGVFRYFDISDVIEGYTEKYFPVARNQDGMVVGLSEIEKNPDEEDIFWIKYISVDPEFRGEGYATKTAQEIFNFAKKYDYILQASSYSTPEGLQQLKPLLKRLAEETGVELIDHDKKIF